MIAPCLSMHLWAVLAVQFERQLVHPVPCPTAAGLHHKPTSLKSNKKSHYRFITNSKAGLFSFLGQLHMWIKHAAESSNKHQRHTRRQNTNNQATKSFWNYCQCLEPPMESQELCNTLESNLINKSFLFSTIMILSVALKDGEIFLQHLLWKQQKYYFFPNNKQLT